MIRLIAHCSMRYSTLIQVTQHPFFDNVQWNDLRRTPAPFVPELESEVDTGYYDDFTSPGDMAKYAEVKEKQRNVAKVKEKEDSFGRGVWVGFTFGKNGPGRKTMMASGCDHEVTMATIF
jgi:cell cycle protein kinase DBF2